MDLGKVEKESFWYSFHRVFLKFAHDKIFYKKVIYIGKENIPKHKPVVYAPNHQNALMDALAVQLAQDRQIVFLARSDIFNNKTIAKFMFFLKILPVFRIRDGKEKLKLNDVIFEKTVEVLELNRTLAIFPEATHIDKRHLRNLKKGIQRAAFLAEQKNDFNLGVVVVPVGIYYSNYWNFRSVLQVRYGKPIPVLKYKEAFDEHQSKAMVSFGNEMTKGIKNEMLDIKDLDYYDVYEALRGICNTKMLENLNLKFSYENKFIADQKIITKVEEIQSNNKSKFNAIVELTNRHIDDLKYFKLKDWVLEKKISGLFVLVRFLSLFILFPLFIYGFLNNIIAYFLPKLITKKLKDRQFTSSIVFGLSVFSFPLLYLIQTIIFYNFTNNGLFTGLYLLSLPVLGLFSFEYSRYFVKTMSQFRFLRNRKSKRMQEMLKNGKKINNLVFGN